MSNIVDLQYRYSEEEYVAAIKYYLDKKYHTRFNIAIALLVTGAGVAFMFLDAGSILGYVFTFLGAILLLVYCRTYFSVPFQWYRQNPMWREESQLQFSDEEIVFRTKDVESKLNWSLYREVWETDRFYFLVYGKDLFSLIPKRVFADERQQRLFKQMLDRHITSRPDDDRNELLTAAEEDNQEYVPKSLEPPDWR
jgi:hypothetical protein